MERKYKMKVLYIFRKCPVSIGQGGVIMPPYFLSNRNGYQVVTIAPECDNNNEVTFQFPDNVCTYHYNKDINHFRKVQFIMNILKREKPDIVHVFIAKSYYWLPVFISLFKFGKKEEAWLLDIQSPAISQKKKAKWRSLIKPIKQIGYDAVCTLNRASALSHLGHIFKPVFIVRLGYSPEISCKKLSKKNTEVKPVKFLYMGAISKARKLEGLLESILILKEKYHITNVIQFDFYGNGDYVNELVDFVKQKKLINIVKYKGVLSYENIIVKMKDYDVGFSYLPINTFYNKSPVSKTIEYIAAGLYVIASNTWANREIIVHGKNGLLTDNDPEQLAQVINDLITKGISSKYILNSGDLLKEYSWEHIVQSQYIPMYKSILEHT
ncbi:MAG: glycosyltransferase [Leptospirales bacterium]